MVHSHLFDFNNGCLYVFATGVLGGTILNERANTLKKLESGSADEQRLRLAFPTSVLVSAWLSTSESHS
jgi:hypothetical protein